MIVVECAVGSRSIVSSRRRDRNAPFTSSTVLLIRARGPSSNAVNPGHSIARLESFLCLCLFRAALLTLVRTVQALLVVLGAGHDLGRLNRAHLGDPSLAGLGLADSAQLVRCVTRDADVVGALENQLDVTDLEYLGAALFGEAAGGVQDIVNEVVCYTKDRLVYRQT
jgi:hypothetical protein